MEAVESTVTNKQSVSCVCFCMRLGVYHDWSGALFYEAIFGHNFGARDIHAKGFIRPGVSTQGIHQDTSFVGCDRKGLNRNCVKTGRASTEIASKIDHDQRMSRHGSLPPPPPSPTSTINVRPNTQIVFSQTLGRLWVGPTTDRGGGTLIPKERQEG